MLVVRYFSVNFKKNEIEKRKTYWKARKKKRKEKNMASNGVCLIPEVIVIDRDLKDRKDIFQTKNPSRLMIHTGNIANWHSLRSRKTQLPVNEVIQSHHCFGKHFGLRYNLSYCSTFYVFYLSFVCHCFLGTPVAPFIWIRWHDADFVRSLFSGWVLELENELKVWIVDSEFFSFSYFTLWKRP